MKESEARKKWCPMKRGDKGCIASDCMMWRTTTEEVWKNSKDTTKGTHWVDIGYCGLANRS